MDQLSLPSVHAHGHGTCACTCICAGCILSDKLYTVVLKRSVRAIHRRLSCAYTVIYLSSLLLNLSCYNRATLFLMKTVKLSVRVRSSVRESVRVLV